tara:strand:- start:2050 stop:2949 length:900 start_codon:yes stop_codon:yes gene_type:complete
MDSQRIHFYLGKILTEDDITFDSYPPKINVSDLHKGGFGECSNSHIYNEPLVRLLNKSNHLDKQFSVAFGDIHYETHPLQLVKNRYHGNESSVILRCFEFERHWGHVYNKPKDIEFNEKQNTVFWRGATTGNESKIGNRFDLITRWFGKDPAIDIGFSFICQPQPHYAQEYSRYVKGECDITQFLQHKYIISVEGNDKDSGLNWKLNSNSVVLMTKPRITSWLMESKLIPDHHYVLLKDDFSDLKEKLDWCNANEERCKEIVKNANAYMDQFKDQKKEEQIEVDLIHAYFDIIKKLNFN